MYSIKLIIVFGIIALANSASISSGVSCICTRAYLPICASNDVTYSNNCLFQCEKKKNNDLEIKFYGECNELLNEIQPEDGRCPCTGVYFPVCGTNGKTYTNACQLTCARFEGIDVELKHFGGCHEEAQVHESEATVSDCICKMDYNPVCGSNGRTFANKCEFDCEKIFTKMPLEIRYTGECKIEAEETVPCLCNFMFMPVCGSDGQTYPSECELKCANKQNNNLKVKHQGEC